MEAGFKLTAVTVRRRAGPGREWRTALPGKRKASEGKTPVGAPLRAQKALRKDLGGK